jgi:hypothetical protein
MPPPREVHQGAIIRQDVLRRCIGKILREPVDLLALHMHHQFARWLSSIPLQVGIHPEKPFALGGGWRDGRRRLSGL